MCEEQMVRGGKVTSNSKKNFNKRFRPKDKGSDDSDEDYVVSNEENGVSDCSDDDYCASLDGHASGEDNFIEEEVEEKKPKKVRKTVGLKARKALGSHKVRQENGRKRRRCSYEEEEDDNDDDEDYSVEDDNDYEEEEAEVEEAEVEEEKEEEEEEEEEDYDDFDEEVEDEDFTLEEEDFSDEEDPFVRMKGNNVKMCRKGARKNTSSRVCKRVRPKAAKKPSRTTGRKNRGRLTVRNSDDGDFSDNYRIVTNTRGKKPVPKRKRCVARSDFDMLVSGSSDYEYTISEEEREQVREAEKLCGNLRTRVRCVPSPKKIEDLNLRQQRKPPVRKGKEKVEEVKAEVVKQVCGICLSEEDKRRVRGTLNCCSHFFCFPCIMEWAKVESRCPLCKQRFQTISKPARSAAGIDLREVVIQVPERDQVYQPSEEELRSYLDPYENVICTECHEGGDDNLMLLCDLCDSPAHTYCVGLGREVPEGNWYCVDCRTIALGSSSSQPTSRLSDRRTTNNLFNRPLPVNREGLDLNSLSSPRTPYIQGFGNVSSPRIPLEVQSTSPSPISQAVAPTLVRRRILRLHINQIRSSNQMGFVNNRTDGVSATNLSGGTLNSQIGQVRETAFEHTRAHEMAIPSQTLFGESLHDNPSPSMQHGDLLNSESSRLSRQGIQDPQTNMSTNITCNGTILNPLIRLAVENTTTTVDRNFNGTLWPEQAGVDSLSNCEQIPHHSSVQNTGSDNGLPPPSVRDENDYCAAMEQLQPIIEIHLKKLSRDIDLGRGNSGDIATKAASTILAACGFEHLINEAYRASPPSQCSHIELLMGGRRSLIKGLCSSCFDAYVGDVVKKITDASLSSWLSLTL